MTIIESIFLGIIQGLTEFIPVSSSGHLELIPKMLNMNQPSTSYITFLHFGTLIALLIYYRKKLIKYLSSLVKVVNKDNRKIDNDNLQSIKNIIVASIPAGILGLLLSKTIENIYDNPDNTRLATVLTAVAMILMGILFIFANKIFTKKKFDLEKLTSKYAFIIGVAQSFALFRGVSRSGITLLAGQAVGLNRVSAAEFGFLMSIPVTFFAALSGTIDIVRNESLDLANNYSIYIVGLLTSLIFGYLAINFMISFLKKRGLQDFGVYRIAFGIISLLILL